MFAYSTLFPLSLFAYNAPPLMDLFFAYSAPSLVRFRRAERASPPHMRCDFSPPFAGDRVDRGEPLDCREACSRRGMLYW